MRIASSSGELLFETPTFLVEELFRIKIFTEKLRQIVSQPVSQLVYNAGSASQYLV